MLCSPSKYVIACSQLFSIRGRGMGGWGGEGGEGGEGRAGGFACLMTNTGSHRLKNVTLAVSHNRGPIEGLP